MAIEKVLHGEAGKRKRVSCGRKKTRGGETKEEKQLKKRRDK